MQNQQIILIERYKIHLSTESSIHHALMNEAKKKMGMYGMQSPVSAAGSGIDKYPWA